MVAQTELTSLRRISPAEAAKILGHGRDFIMELAKAGEIQLMDERKPGSKIPRWTISPADLRTWQESRARVFVKPERPPGFVVMPHSTGLMNRMRDGKREKQERARDRARTGGRNA